MFSVFDWIENQAVTFGEKAVSASSITTSKIDKINDSNNKGIEFRIHFESGATQVYDYNYKTNEITLRKGL